jgi:tetratricopeptide (TPR) repeat protein
MHRLANTKGFILLDMLSRLIGRERFAEILRKFIRGKNNQLTSWQEFQKFVEANAKKDVRWFFEQWFERTGAPNWELMWKQEGEILRGTITQNAPYYRAKVEIETRGNYAERRKTAIEVRGARTEFTIPVKFKAQTVELDPHYLFLRWTPEYRAEADALAEYMKANRKRNEGKSDEAQNIFEGALKSVPQPDLYGAEFMLRYGLARIFISQKKWSDARTQLEIAISSPTRPAEVLPRAYLQLARAFKETGDKDALKRAVDAAIAADAAIGGRTGVTLQVRTLINK